MPCNKILASNRANTTYPSQQRPGPASRRTIQVPAFFRARRNNASERCSAMRLGAAAIIEVLPSNETNIMDAEHINSIANKLDDIAQRAAELRRYL